MFDANGVVCTDINKAFLQVLSSEEVLKMSVCRVTSSTVFCGDVPVPGGLHDPAMGSLDTRFPCVTCGLRRDCPGHLGHIELPLLVFHPTLLGSLVRLLRMVCFRCRRLKIDMRTASVYLKKFQLVSNGMLEDAEKFDLLQRQSSIAERLYKASKTNTKISAKTSQTMESEGTKRVQLVELFNRLRAKESDRRASQQSLEADISDTHTSVEAWTSLRREFFLVEQSRSSCYHCRRVYSTSVKMSRGGTGIQLTWPWGTEKPFSRSTWFRQRPPSPVKEQNDGVYESSCVSQCNSDIDDDEETMIHGRRGRVMGSIEFQSYHLISLLETLWNSPERPLLEFLFPMSIKNGWEMFFIRYLPVSSNRFRPLSQNVAVGGAGKKRGSSAQQSILHTRTSSLSDIVTAVEKLEFAIKVLQHPDPLKALTSSSLNDTEFSSAVTELEKTKLKKSILEHKGNYRLLNNYSKELQQYINQYIDSTKTLNPWGKRLAPGLRQWMERKEGAIRQKMMGKRVNFVARTVVAPDNCINTNEIGIPLDFAMKLMIPEYVTPQAAQYLQKLVENGAHSYPGANMVRDSNGYVYDLAVMSDEQRIAKARVLFADTAQDGLPKIVYRHVRNGDVVVMNRQPTLHRASIMAHFVRVLPGWKTFRLMYVNCGSYNADFDGDEMNMHLPQDPTSRAEAKSIINADRQYITVKNGEPLRGLIQDHVLGGTFLTCRNTFLDVNQYYTLVYTGLSSFVDAGSHHHFCTPSKAPQNIFKTHSGDTGGTRSTSSFAFKSSADGALKILVEPPALLKPKKLWTGKQVITTILKTVVDTIACSQFSKDAEFLKSYDGLSFSAQSKTPGDAWGGVLDGDNEESTIIISQSELLQGVFDKSMFGASSFGFVHLCYELLGPATAGLLLSIFAKTFSCYLQMRGFSCCTGDFLMTPEGEKNRMNIIRQCILAGTYVEEAFIDCISREMQWIEQLKVKQSCGDKLKKVHRMILNDEEAFNEDSVLGEKQKNSVLQNNVYLNFNLDGLPLQSCVKNETTHTSWEERCKEDTVTAGPTCKVGADDTASNHAPLLIPSKTLQPWTRNSGVWEAARHFHLPTFHTDWRLKYTGEHIVTSLKSLTENILRMTSINERLTKSVLIQLAKTPQLALYFPHVAHLVGAHHLWTTQVDAYKASANSDILTKFERAEDKSYAIPHANRYCVAANGRMLIGDGSLKLPQLYHPSWLYTQLDGFDFDDTQRYVKALLQKDGGRYMQEKLKPKPFSLVPNELTRYRLETLARQHFAGKEASLVKIMDGLFQAAMGKLMSKNNDLVAGHTTLYKFPTNGFASMIITGAKGSKVNFAMICGMLSQQSLEGKRVPVMVSGKTLPSFGFYDFGTRAGGLITDCYLRGLRPQEYFFHCMAGREGLVDTAVKTARSGYLQRCVMKGMEGIFVQYDGTVRDSDGTIVQFLYGDDGVDVSKASYTKKLEDLLQNPALIKAKYASETKLNHSKVRTSLSSINAWLNNCKQHETEDFKSAWVEKQKLVSRYDPLTNIFHPIAFVGCTSEKYFAQVKQLLDQDAHQFVSQYGSIPSGTSGQPLSKQSNALPPAAYEEARERLKSLLLLKYSEALCAPGEAVGCISAQSMGEPATQMTLNTFHLAGHGAANVTLGIPRLREILQTAGATKTPIIYAPVRGDNHDVAAKNAENALLGFKKIPLSDVVHAVGVESNVYCQVRSQDPTTGDVTPGIPEREFFWEYETTIQFENLDHFCAVVPQFTPHHILIVTLNRVVREMAKQVNRLVYLYATNYAEEVLDSDNDELECAASRYIFNRNIRSHFTRRDMRKERARVAGVGFGKHSVNASSIDLMTNADVAKTLKMSTKNKMSNEDFIDDAAAPQEEQTKEENALDSDSSVDDSEQDFSESEKGEDIPLEGIDRDTEDSDQDGDKQEGHRSSHDDMSATEDEDMLPSTQKNTKCDTLTAKSYRKRKEEMKSKWNAIHTSLCEQELVTSKTHDGVEPKLESFPNDHILKTSVKQKHIKFKSLPDDAYRFLTDIQISRECWTIRVKFGWPFEKCPRRVTLLNHFVRIIRKCMLQDTPGVGNPRILGGNQAETKSLLEIQCEGSNFGWIFGLREDCIDHTRVTTNDIRTLLHFLGVEACRSSIIRELNKVFSVYGITVDYRHMSLIADTMTHSGLFRPFSRLGIQHHSSPLLQMSFETSMKFLTDAVQRGASDNLKTPAGAIVTGRPVIAGTGLCRVLTRIDLKKRSQHTRSAYHSIKESCKKDVKDSSDIEPLTVKEHRKKRTKKREDAKQNKKHKFTFS